MHANNQNEPARKGTANAKSGTAQYAVDGIIFDIDNVLVDTRLSYLDAIRWTVEIYLTAGKVPYFRLTEKSKDPQLLSHADVEEFKLLGGFNDDWDCCYGILVYLLSLPVQKRTSDQLKKMMNLKGFVSKVKQYPLRVNGIVQMLGRPSTVTIEKISRIFQEVYLGRDLFQLVEKKRPVFWKKRGLIRKERLIFRKSTIEKLKELGFQLGIATGRSRFEAQYALKRFGVLHAFDAITTMNEVKHAESEMKKSLRKPHPFSLLETAKKMGVKKRFFYVGDLPDDVLAAHQAQSAIHIQSVAYPWCAADPAKALAGIKKFNPGHLLKKPSDLIALAMGHK